MQYLYSDRCRRRRPFSPVLLQIFHDAQAASQPLYFKYILLTPSWLLSLSQKKNGYQLLSNPVITLPPVSCSCLIPIDGLICYTVDLLLFNLASGSCLLKTNLTSKVHIIGTGIGQSTKG
jgi:hypothetical protein